MKKILITILFVFIALLYSNAQEGFYVGAGLNMYNAWEEVSSSTGEYNFSHSTKSASDGFFTQSLVKYGFGVNVGYRYNIDNSNGKNILTLDGQYYYNYQNVLLQNKFDQLTIKTKANYNHGFRLAFGHHFGKIHPYILVQGIFQNVSPKINVINNNGVVYDVDDNKKILDQKLASNGNSFSTFVGSFLGGFGIEVPLNEKFVVDINYTPMKHVEYGLRDTNNSNNYFVNNLVINNLQLGFKFFPWKKRNAKNIQPDVNTNR